MVVVVVDFAKCASACVLLTADDTTVSELSDGVGGFFVGWSFPWVVVVVVGGFVVGWSFPWVVVVVVVVSVHVVSLRATVAFSRELSRYSTLIPVLACSITRLL